MILEIREVLSGKKFARSQRSQRSFITEKIRTEKISISVYGDSKESRLENLDVVEYRIKHRFENPYSVQALVYPVICSDIKGQLVSVAKEQYDHISRLILADLKTKTNVLHSEY